MEAQNTSGEEIKPKLAQEGARYYTTNVGHEVQMDVSAAELQAEIQRVHEEAKKAFLVNAQDPEARNPYREHGWTWAGTLEYIVFHTAYHTGQIYSVRHLLGHETVDN